MFQRSSSTVAAVSKTKAANTPIASERLQMKTLFVAGACDKMYSIELNEEYISRIQYVDLKVVHGAEVPAICLSTEVFRDAGTEITYQL